MREAGARLDAEVVEKSLAGSTQNGQRVGLSSGLVVRECQDGPPVFAQWGCAHEALGFGDDRPVLAGIEASLEQFFLSTVSDLVEPHRLHDSRLPAGKFGVRGTAPKPQRPSIRVDSAIVFAVQAVLSRAGYESLEADRIDDIWFDAEGVFGALRGDGILPQASADARDRGLDLLRPGRGQGFTPVRVGQLGRRHRTTVADDEGRQDDPLARAERFGPGIQGA